MKYVGTELELFRDCVQWKTYVGDALAPWLRGRVLEVGAGIGGTTRALCRRGPVVSWTALEPDPELWEELKSHLSDVEIVQPVRATLEGLDPGERFDSIVYVDVLEHVEDDAAELHRAAGRLAAGGHLVVVSPAHPFLYTAFDRAIGHHRRYSLRALTALGPSGLSLVHHRLLDSVGLVASTANRLLLRQAMPTRRQLWIWDRWMVRASRLLDPVLRYRVGKSIMVAWRAPDGWA
jgi:SAM-dependent methyltransferase